MNRFSSALLLGSRVLALSLTAWGQQRPYSPPRDDPYYRNDPNRGYNDDRYYRGDDRYGNGGNEDALIGRVLSDLNRAASNARLDGHERKHFNEVAQKLQEFE